MDLSVTPSSGRRAEVIERQRMRVPAPGALAFRFDPGGMAEMFGAPGNEFRFEMFDRPSRLGVGVQGLTPDLADYFGAKDGGVLVTSIEKDSPAAKAGLKAGDVITTVDGASVDDTGELRRRLWKDEDATEVSLGIVRDKKALTVKVPVESQKKPATLPKTGRTKA